MRSGGICAPTPDRHRAADLIGWRRSSSLCALPYALYRGLTPLGAAPPRPIAPIIGLCEFGGRLTSAPNRSSLGLLPSGPDPVGEWLVHRQPPALYIGRHSHKGKDGPICYRASQHPAPVPGDSLNL